MKALGIARVSTKAQATDDHFSLTYQREVMTQHAAQKGWELVDVVEYVKSGGSNAKELQQILQQAQAARADVVMVYELDRLARDMVTTLLFLEELAQHKIRFYSCADNLDLSTPEGELQMHILAMFAAYFRKQLSRKVKAGKLERAKAGKRDGERPFGYQPSGDTWAIDPQEAPIVQQVFHWYLREDMGFRAIAKRLNERRVPGQKGRTGTWDARTVERMLRREAYAGDTVHGKWIWHRGRDGQSHLERGQNPLVMRDTHPAIIDRDTWDAAQARLATKAMLGPRSQGSPYLLSGLVRCGNCGTSMVIIRTGQRRKDGTRDPVYVCRAYHTKGQCSTATRIPLAQLERAVGHVLARELEAAQKRVTGAQVRRWMTHDTDVQTATATVQRLRHRQREIPAMLERAEEAMLQGVYDVAQFARVRDRLQLEAQEVAEQLAAAHDIAPVDTGRVIARILHINELYRRATAGDETAQRAVRPLLQGLIAQIDCHAERHVTVNFREVNEDEF